MKLKNGDFKALYSDAVGTARLNQVRLAWLAYMSNALHLAGKSVTVNYSLDLPPLSPPVQKLITLADGFLYEDWWGGDYPKGIYSSARRMNDLFTYFDEIKNRGKRLHLIFQLPSADRANIQTAMATYLLVADKNTSVFISSVQRYGIIPNYMGYDKSIGTPCGDAYQSNNFWIRKYTEGIAVLRSPDTGHGQFPLPEEYLSVDGSPLPPHVEINATEGIVAYKPNATECR